MKEMSFFLNLKQPISCFFFLVVCVFSVCLCLMLTYILCFKMLLIVHALCAKLLLSYSILK